MEDKVHFRFISNCDLLSIIEFMQKKGRYFFKRTTREAAWHLGEQFLLCKHAGNMFF